MRISDWSSDVCSSDLHWALGSTGPSRKRGLLSSPAKAGAPDWTPRLSPGHEENTNMPKVLISDQMDPKAAEVFRAHGVEVDEKPGLTKAELKAIIGAYDGLAISSATQVTRALMEAATKPKIVGTPGTGWDNDDIPAASAPGGVGRN